MLQQIYYFNKLILDGIPTLKLRETYSGVRLDAYAAALTYECNNVLLSDSASFLKVNDVEHIENLNCRTGAPPKSLSPFQLLPVKCQWTNALRRKTFDVRSGRRSSARLCRVLAGWDKRGNLLRSTLRVRAAFKILISQKSFLKVDARQSQSLRCESESWMGFSGVLRKGDIVIDLQNLIYLQSFHVIESPI